MKMAIIVSEFTAEKNKMQKEEKMKKKKSACINGADDGRYVRNSDSCDYLSVSMSSRMRSAEVLVLHRMGLL